MSPSTPIMKAATVVVSRITKQWPYKILLLKREDSAKFLPGAYVFPGGRLDQEDKRFAQILAKDKHNIDRVKKYFGASEQEASERLAAAIRETYEEAGLSILHTEGLDKSAPVGLATLKSLIKGEKLPSHDSALSLANIWPISWWVTPEGEKRRFDTWFFIATVTADRDPSAEEINSNVCPEVSDARWFSPQQALELYEKQQLFLPPPTRSVLERLQASSSLNHFLSFVDQPITPIHPLFKSDKDQKKILVLPGDELHPQDTPPKFQIKTRYFFP